MLNKELIDHLKTLPPEAEIRVYDPLSDTYDKLYDVIDYDESENTIFLTGSD